MRLGQTLREHSPSGTSTSRALKVVPDEPIYVTPLRQLARRPKLLKRLRRVAELPPADQRAVLKLVDAMLDTRRRSAAAPRGAKRKAS